MNKKSKVSITFIISAIIAFLIVGYVKNAMFARIDWIDEVTVWDKFREYYIRTFSSNVIPAIVMAVIPTLIVYFANRNKA